MATELSGNQVTELIISFASDYSKASKSGNIFISEDLKADPVTKTDVTITDNYNNGTGWSHFAFETPYTIKAGQGFYMGYEVKKCSYLGVNIDYPVAVTDNIPGDFCGEVEVFSPLGTSYGTYSGADLGCNIFLQAVTVGPKRAVNNVFTIGEPSVGEFTLPVIPGLNDATASLPVANYGTNAVTSIDYTASCGPNTLSSKLSLNVASGIYDYIAALPLPTLVEGRGTIDVSISAVNGVPTDIKKSMSYIGLPSSGYDRKFVVEEGTGSWCGWCPHGIVAFEQCEERYPDAFIGIAVHYGDEMKTSSYTPLVSKFFSSFPKCIVNRDSHYNVNPTPSNLEECHTLWASERGAARVTADVYYADAEHSALNVITSTEFAFRDPEATYSLAYVVLEDGVMGAQTNIYSGGSYGEMGGWEDAESPRPWSYKHVARNIFTCWGLEGSVPASVEAARAYKHEYKVELTKVDDPAMTSLVVLLLDNTTGTVLNATKVKAADYKTDAGVGSILVDEAPAEYFNLQGMPMPADDLPAGIYIVRRGSQVTKTVVR